MKFHQMTESKFYVFDYSEVKELFYHCNTDEEKDKIVNDEAEKCMYFDDILDWMWLDSWVEWTVGEVAQGTPHTPWIRAIITE